MADDTDNKIVYTDYKGEDAIQRALFDRALIPPYAAAKLGEELEATVTKAQVVEVPRVIENSDGTTTIITVREWTYSAPMVDWATRQSARRDLIKLWGGSPKEPGVGSDDTPLIVRIKDYSK